MFGASTRLPPCSIGTTYAHMVEDVYSCVFFSLAHMLEDGYSCVDYICAHAFVPFPILVPYQLVTPRLRGWMSVANA